MKKNNRGFTIVELVIVIAVIGVLAAVLIPTFTVVIRKAKISRGEQNAYNISLNLATDAAFEGVSYYTADRVIDKVQNEYGYTLSSELDKYSYWYDASLNKVVYSETSTTIGTDDLLATVAYADESEFVNTVRSIAGVPSLYYIEQSDNKITKAINTIENLVEVSNYDKNSMQGNFDDTVNVLGDKIKTYLSAYSPAQTAYICDRGIFTPSSDSSLQNAVVCAKTTTIPRAKVDAASITIVNKIVIPATVILIEDNAFAGVTATLEINSSIGMDASKIGGTVKLEVKSANNAGKIIPLTSSDYALNYGYQKEAKDIAGTTYTALATYDEGNKEYTSFVQLGNLSDFSSDASVVDSIVCQYMVPSLSLVNNQSVYFGDIEKLSVRSKPVDGGVEYVLVAVDKDFNVYKLSNVGSLNEAKITYGRNPLSNENVILEFGKTAVAFSNLAGITYELTYQTGYSDIVTEALVDGSSYYRETGFSSWNSDSLSFVSSIAVSAKNTAVIDLSGKTVMHNGESVNCNVANVTAVTVYDASHTAILTQYYDAKSTNTGAISITLNSNISGNEVAETINTYVGRTAKLEHSLFTDALCGYKLLSWNTAPDGSGTSYSSSGATFTESTSLYAITEPYVFDIIFNMYYPSDNILVPNEVRLTVNAKVGDTIVISDGGDKFTVGDRVYNTNFSTAIAALSEQGFTFNRWDCAGNANFYGSANYLLSNSLDCSIPVDTTLASKISNSTNDRGTLYVFGCNNGNINVYLKNGSIAQTFTNLSFFSKFTAEVKLAAGCTGWYEQPNGQGEYISYIYKTSMITRNAYYAN